MSFEEIKEILKSRADNKDNVGKCDSVCWRCSKHYKFNCTEYDKALNAVIAIAETTLKNTCCVK